MSSYVEVAQGRSRHTVVFVHPIGGGVGGFDELSALLPRTASVAALMARGLTAGESPHTNMRTMARDYVVEVCRRRDPASVILVGYSFGGFVAFEMARQLEALGTRPAGVLLLDAYPGTPELSATEDFLTLVEIIYRVPARTWDLKGSHPDLFVPEVAERALATGLVPPQYPPALLPSMLAVLWHNIVMAREHVAQPYAGPVTLALPLDAPADEPDVAREAWRDLALGPLEVCLLGDAHLDFLSGAGAVRIAEYLTTTWFADLDPVVTPCSTP